MKILPLFLVCLANLLPAAPLAKKAAVYPATYAGGSLPLNHHKVRASFGNNEVVFMQGGSRIAVPVGTITEISCGTEVRRRLVGESETYYIGVAWSAASGNDPRAQVLLKLNRGEYRVFLAALEQATGMKAIDTNRVQTIVRYKV